ncbi:hypothetical protein [Mesorhizobium sp. B2-8-9]|uniref:hypothetical protein n=1 Tax=Mesorhizobium sp. B2-8-9 TaxID=2589899 RepID=UPI0015E364C4|nr:hypothetical protein [Mesorhizobium sp. B2-8-9]
MGRQGGAGPFRFTGSDAVPMYRAYSEKTEKTEKNRTEPRAMRAETLNIVDEIRQAITLLRRHL